jgi:hypothetical protein
LGERIMVRGKKMSSPIFGDKKGILKLLITSSPFGKEPALSEVEGES